MVLRMKNFNILGIHWKIRLLGGCSQKNNIDGRGHLEMGVWTVYLFKGGVGKKEWGGDFEGRVWYPMHTMLYVYVYFLFLSTKISFSLFHFFFVMKYQIFATEYWPFKNQNRCLWNCLCNSCVINLRWVGLPFCQLPKVDLGQPIQIQLMGSAGLWDLWSSG